MKEPKSNYGYVCKDHAPKPGKYKDEKAPSFIGKWVKLGFPATDGTIEHMWVKVTHIDKDEIFGYLDNDPTKTYDPVLEAGTEVAFTIDEIEDVTS